jgi:hypothetical protein
MVSVVSAIYDSRDPMVSTQSASLVTLALSASPCLYSREAMI